MANSLPSTGNSPAGTRCMPPFSTTMPEKILCQSFRYSVITSFNCQWCSASEGRVTRFRNVTLPPKVLSHHRCGPPTMSLSVLLNGLIVRYKRSPCLKTHITKRANLRALKLTKTNNTEVRLRTAAERSPSRMKGPLAPQVSLFYGLQ